MTMYPTLFITEFTDTGKTDFALTILFVKESPLNCGHEKFNFTFQFPDHSLTILCSLYHMILGTVI